jgi:hypothetical protein
MPWLISSKSFPRSSRNTFKEFCFSSTHLFSMFGKPVATRIKSPCDYVTGSDHVLCNVFKSYAFTRVYDFKLFSRSSAQFRDFRFQRNL